MENLNEQEQEVKPKKGKLKNKIIAIFLLIVISFGVYGYFWYDSTKKLIIEAKESIKKADSYDELLSAIEEERNRCEDFIVQQEGNFGSFEYCKKFIEWSNNK